MIQKYHIILFIYISENRKFSDVFRGYRGGTLVENGLISGWLWGSFHIDYIFTFSIDSVVL